MITMLKVKLYTDRIQVANLVEKYGLVPQTCYPDAFNASSSSMMDKLMTTKLREDALRIRAATKSAKTTSTDLQAMKYHMMREIHTILTLMLGPPPAPDKEFTWQYYDSEGKYHSLTTTPLGFAGGIASTSAVKAMGTNVLSFFSLVHDPRNKMNTLLTVDRLGNVSTGRPVTYINTEISLLKATAVAMLKKGVPVFFGSDVGQWSNREGYVSSETLHVTSTNT
jgi:bleomycin hydrolase